MSPSIGTACLRSPRGVAEAHARQERLCHRVLANGSPAPVRPVARLDAAVRFVLEASPRYRIPEPTRLADKPCRMHGG